MKTTANGLIREPAVGQVRHLARCHTCRWSRDYGAAKQKCAVEAGKHARRFPEHRVGISEDKITHLFTVAQTMAPLDDTPPF